MSDRTPLLEQLARRNPVPQPADPPSDAWDLATVRLELVRRETAMDTLEQTPRTRPGAGPPRRGGWLIAAAAFAVVIVVGLVAFIGGGDDSVAPTTAAAVDSTTEAPPTTTTEAPPTTTDAPPATEATTTTEAVDLIAESEALLDALYTNDVAGLEALVSPRADTTFMVYFAGFVDVILDEFNGEILGWTCSETVASNVIRCEVEFTDDVIRAAGADQATETWEIGYAFDGVQSAGYSTADPDPTEPAVRAMFEAHPEWWEAGGPCDGFFEGGDPTSCARAWSGFIIEWFTENG